jgi:putative transposase
MTVLSSVPAGDDFERQLAAAEPDMLRAMVKSFAEALMSAEADAACGAGYGQVSPERTNSRNGYRTRPWDTRVGSIEPAVPKLRSGSYFPEWLLERRRRAEQALMSVVATAYLLGVSTRRVERLAAELGVTQLSKSQVSAMAKHLDEQVAAFRNRPLDAGPYPVLWIEVTSVLVVYGVASGAAKRKARRQPGTVHPPPGAGPPEIRRGPAPGPRSNPDSSSSPDCFATGNEAGYYHPFPISTREPPPKPGPE